MVDKTAKFLLLFTLIFSSVFLPIKSYGKDDSCSDLLVVFARGSGQNRGETINEGIYVNSGLKDDERQSKSFFDEIDKRLNKLKIEYISLHDLEGRYNQNGYIAIDVATGFKNKPRHRKDVPNLYYESVTDGTEELTWFLEDKMSSCPFQQIILGGCSQGAHVVGNALFKLQPRFRPRIAFVALYGDPKYNPRVSSVPVKAGPWARGNATSVQSGILGPRAVYIPDELVGRVGSWCDLSDPICSNYGLWQVPGANIIADSFVDKTHSNIYQNKWIPQSANDIAYMIQRNNPILSSRVQTTPWVNKNDKLYQLDLALVLDTTGSMSSIINPIIDNLSAFVSALFGSYWDTRVGVVGFNDPTTPPPWTYYGPMPYFSKKIMDFTHSKTDVGNALKGSYVGFGGDDPEALYSGLMTAMNDLSWRPGAQKKILVITDAPAKDPDPGPGYWTKQQVIKRALELDPASISVSALPRPQPWPYTNNAIQKVEDEFTDTVKALSIATNGVITEGSRDYKLEYVTNTITKMEFLPVATIDGDARGATGQTMHFSAGSSYDADSSIIKYEWDFNNDGVWDIVSDSPSIEHAYTSLYSGLVVLQVTSADGDSAKAIHNITILNEVPAQPQPQPPVVKTVTTRVNSSTTVEWVNDYPENTVVKINDAQGEVLDIVPANTKSYPVDNLPNKAVDLQLFAGNESGWSDVTDVTIPALLQFLNLPAKDVFRQNSNSKQQLNAHPQSVDATAPSFFDRPILINNTSQAARNLSSNQVKASKSIVNVKGVSNVANPYKHNVHSSKNNWLTKSLVAIICLLGVWPILMSAKIKAKH